MILRASPSLSRRAWHTVSEQNISPSINSSLVGVLGHQSSHHFILAFLVFPWFFLGKQSLEAVVFGPRERIIGHLCVIRSSTDTASMGQDREEVFKAVNLSLLLPFTASVSRVRNESAYISVSLKKKLFICLCHIYVLSACMSGRHVPTWYLQRPEEAIRSLGQE